MEGIIILLALTALMMAAYYIGRKTGQYEAYEEAFDDVVCMYEEALREEAAEWTK